MTLIANNISPMPPVPQKINVGGHLYPIYTPFYYGSLSALWVYYQVDPEILEPYLEGTGFAAALFDGKAVVDLNFQSYTAHGGQILETCNEVEFNALVYPTSLADCLPEITFAEFLAGVDQSKTFGHLRLHVPADNAFAVAAGKALFGEPKFLASFTTSVPALNDPPAKVWNYSCQDPVDPNSATSPASIYNLVTDLQYLAATPANSSPLVEYGVLDGRPIGSHWDIYGIFQTYLLAQDQSERVKLTYGTSDLNGMRTDMKAIIGDAHAVAAQVFVSTPVGTESRAYYVDLPGRSALPTQAVVAASGAPAPAG
jgi:hypothetical protein